MSSLLISLALWSFLPNLVTGWLQNIYYAVTIRAGEPHPQPGTPRFNKHRRTIFCIVIGAYLLYTIYEVDWNTQREGNFYQDLGVPYHVDLRTLKSHARRLKAKAHPDRADPMLRAPNDHVFINLTKAEETLANPAKRFAYERFGPDILSWKNCVTEGDYIKSGFQALVVRYIGSVLGVVIAQFTGRFPHGTYWQYLTISSLFVFEVTAVTRPTFPIVISKLINPLFETLRIHPPYLPFQIIRVAQQAALSMFIAISQLAPAFKTGAASDPNNQEAQQQQMNQLQALTAVTQQGAQRLVGLDLAPFSENPQAERRLKDQVKAWLVQNELNTEPGVSAAIQRVVARRNGDIGQE